MNKVFLGGTVGNNPWREQILIPGLLKRGVCPEKIFNPVVPHWSREIQEQEDALKRDPDCLLIFVLANPDPGKSEQYFTSAYSLAEAIMNLYDAPERTAVLFDLRGFSRRTEKGLIKIGKDLENHFPEKPFFYDYALFMDWIARALEKEAEPCQH